MGQLIIKYCQNCGNRISPEDFEQNVAVTVNNLCYCGKCKTDLPLDQQKSLRETRSKQKPVPLTTQARPMRQSRHQVDRQVRQSKNANLIWIAGVAALLVIAVAVFAIQPEKERRRKTEPRKTDLENNIQTQQNKEDAQGNQSEEREREKLAQETFDSLKRQSSILCKQGNFDMALKVWENIPKNLHNEKWTIRVDREKALVQEAKRDENPEVIFESMKKRAEISLRSGKIDSAIAVWENVPAQIASSEWLDRIDEERKRYRAIKWDMQGWQKQKDKDLNGALSCYTRAIRMYPKLADAFSHRGLLYLIQGKPFKAEKDYTQAIALTPDSARKYRDYYYRGGCYLQQKQLNKGCADLCKAVELAPNCKEMPHICKNFREILKNDPKNPYAMKMREYLKKYDQ